MLYEQQLDQLKSYVNSVLLRVTLMHKKTLQADLTCNSNPAYFNTCQLCPSHGKSKGLCHHCVTTSDFIKACSKSTSLAYFSLSKAKAKYRD